MQPIVKGLIISCGALLLSGGAFGQNYGRVGVAYFQDHDRWDRDRMAHEYRGAFYDRLQSDLARAENAGYLRGDDFDRFRRAHREVGEFQDKWSRGNFDPREMDEAIGAVQRVAEIPSLRREDREALRGDLAAMRRFRAHMEERRY